MNKRLAWMIAFVVAGMVAGCVGPEKAGRSEKGRLLQDAEKYVLELKNRNQLPGFGSNEHGRVIAAAPWAGGKVSYPASVIVQVSKEGQQTSYCYGLAKDTAQQPWQLVRAERLDKGGKVVEELLQR